MPTFTANGSGDETIIEPTGSDEEFDLGFRPEVQVVRCDSKRNNTPKQISKKEIELINSVTAHSVAVDEEEEEKKRSLDDRNRKQVASLLKRIVSYIHFYLS